MSKIIDGLKISKILKNNLKNEILKLNKPPHLAIIIIHGDSASEIYVKNKIKDCKEVGINTTKIELDKDVSEENIIDIIEKLNKNIDIDGIIVQLPLPKNLNQNKIINTIHYNKDADGFTAVNIGNMVLGNKCIIPATPLAIMEILKFQHINTTDKNIVVLGRSNIVGRPISILLSNKSEFGNANVTVLHSLSTKTYNYTLNADILISAIGKPRYIKEGMIKKNSILIDVGISIQKNQITNKRIIVGDIDFKNVLEKVLYITPVPKGVGPVTRSMLLWNTFKCYKKIHNNEST